MTHDLHRPVSSGNGSSQAIPGAAVPVVAVTTLSQSQDLTQQILESSDDCIKVLDLEGRILFMSPGGQALLGIQDITPFLHKPWAEFWTGVAQQAAIEAIAGARVGKVFTFQGYRSTLTGEPKWWDIKVSPIRGAEGQIERLLCISRDITERKRSQDKRQQAEEQLRQSEKHLSIIFSQAAVGLAEVSLDGRFQRVNDELCRLLGRSQEEMLAAGVLEVTHPEDVPKSLEAIKQLLDTGGPISLDKRYLRPDGTTVWASSSITRLDDEQGRPYRMLAVTVDLSDRKRAEEISHRAAKLNAFRVCLADALRPLANPVEIQATASRVLGEYLGANRVAYFEVCGANYVVERDYTNGANPLMGSYSIDSFGPTLLAAYRSGRTVFACDVQADPNLSSDQRVAYAAIQIGAYIGIPLVKDGEFVAGLAVHNSSRRVWTQDEVTLAEEVAERTWAAVEHARAKAVIMADLQDMQLLHELGARLVNEGDIQTLYEKIMSAAVTITRAQAGTVQILDEATQDLVLLATQGFEQNIIKHFYHVNADSNTPCGIALNTGKRSFVDFDVPESEDPDSSRRVIAKVGYRSGQSTPLITRSGRIIGMLSTHWRERHRPSDRELRFLDLLARQATDLIEQRQTAAEREQLLAREQAARAEADRANRVKDEFLAVLSHELRSPLNPILGWSRLLQSGKLDPSKSQQALSIIERNAQLQSELIEDLLDISRILQGKLNLNTSPINLVSIIRAAMETVRLAAEAKSIEIKASFAEVNPVLGDATRLQQIVWNLLSNAVKFTPEGGQVTIQLERLTSHVHIIVSDTGQGIASDFLPYVFDHFRQENTPTTQRSGGLGLGLAIVRHLVELHGGTVEVESPGVGLGTTFTVKLPFKPMEVTANQNSAPSEASYNLNDIKVLVVDDEPDSREFVAFVLEQAGANVLTAATANEALTLIIRAKPDVLLSDIGMPNMDGYMLIQKVRALPPKQGGQVPAIALSAYAGDFNQAQSLAAGFQQHIAKPVEPEELVRAIIALVKS